jgi:hypothetical protein
MLTVESSQRRPLPRSIAVSQVGDTLPRLHRTLDRTYQGPLPGPQAMGATATHTTAAVAPTLTN